MAALAERPNLQDIKARLNCRDVARRYLEPKTSLGRYDQYFAPDRPEKQASFTVYDNGFKDYGGDGDKGDVFKLIQRLENVDFPRALEIARELAGLNPSNAPRPHQLPVRTVTPGQPASWQTPEWQEAATAAQMEAERHLWSDTAAAREVRAYLHHERRLKDETIKAFHLGWNPARYKTTYKPAGQAAMLAAGVTIPTFEGGQLVALKVRRLNPGPDEPKYIQLAGGKQGALFNGDAIRPDLSLVTVEGEFDGMIGQQEAGHLAIFVTVGSASNELKAEACDRLKESARIFGAPDNDPAGDKAFLRWQAAVEAERLPIPAAKDLTEFFARGGDVAAWVAAGLARPRPILLPVEIPPDIIAGMLLCGYEAALVCLRAVKFGYLDTIARASRFRGKRQLELLDAAAGVSKPDTRVLSNKEGLSPPVESGFETLPSYSQIRAALQPLLVARLIEFCYPLQGADPILPDPALPINGHALADEIWSDLPAEERAAVEVAAKDQDAEQTREYRNKYAYARQFLKFTSLPVGALPKNPKNGPEYAAFFLRAVKNANPDRDLSRFEMGLCTGRRPQNLKLVLSRAGIENEAQPVKTVRLSGSTKAKLAACQAAKGIGQIVGIVSIDDQGNTERRSLDDSDLQPWADDQVKAGRALDVRLRCKAKQQIIGDVQPTKPRERKPVTAPAVTAAQQPFNLEGEAAAPESPVPPTPRAPRYIGPGLAPDWLAVYRDVVVRRLNRVSFDLVGSAPEALPIDDAEAPWRSWFAEKAKPGAALEFSEFADPAEAAPAKPTSPPEPSSDNDDDLTPSPDDPPVSPTGEKVGQKWGESSAPEVHQKCTELIPPTPMTAEERQILLDRHAGESYHGPASNNPAYDPLTDRLDRLAAGKEV